MYPWVLEGYLTLFPCKRLPSRDGCILSGLGFCGSQLSGCHLRLRLGPVPLDRMALSCSSPTLVPFSPFWETGNLKSTHPCRLVGATGARASKLQLLSPCGPGAALQNPQVGVTVAAESEMGDPGEHGNPLGLWVLPLWSIIGLVARSPWLPS